MKIRRLAGAAALLLASALPLAATAVPSANADTSSGYGKAEYQTAFSVNCDNPSICGGQNLGGFWGWSQFNVDGTGNAQLNNCGHLEGGGPAAGAQHFADDIADLNGQPGWYIGPNGDFWITNETATFTGRNGGPPITVVDPTPPYPLDTGIPTAPGHYSTADLLGFTAPPGESIQIQVTKIPA